MKYESQNNGLLSVDHVEQGTVITIIEEAYMTTSQSTGKEYWNAKVELPDGSHKLANVGGITGDLFEEAWGSETRNWIDKRATVDIRTSKNTGNSYIVLVLVQNADNKAPKRVEPLRSGYAQSDRIAAERGEMNKPMEPITNFPEDGGDINVADIPF
jgi:hypothetical protein